MPEAGSGTSEGAGSKRLKGWLAEYGRRFPDKVFVSSLDQGKSITYGQFQALTHKFACYLGRLGLKVNDRVALLANNSLEHFASYIGVMAHGATICTIHVEMNAAHLGEILRRLRPRLVLYEAGLGVERWVAEAPGDWVALGDWQAQGGTGLFGLLNELPIDGGSDAALYPGLDDDGCICFTSGTEATPKGVVLSFGELLDNVEPTADAFALVDTDRILDYRSYNWVSAQILSGLAPLAKGATVLMARKFSASRFFDWVRDHGATIAAGNPTTINMLMSRVGAQSAMAVPTLRFITSSSAPLMVAEWQRFEERFGIPIAQGYGTSETGWIAGSHEGARRLGSVGRPLPYHGLTIVDGEGCALPPGATGLVELGNEPTRHYRYLAENGAIRTNAQGRIRTGDLGHLDADGFLYLTGRDKDLIIRGGINIAPLEIDGVLMRRVEVAEAVTVGVPDPIHGEEVVSYIVLTPGVEISEAALLAHCAERLPPAKMPKRILFRAALPKTERGKMDRKALVAEWVGSRSDPAMQG